MNYSSRVGSAHHQGYDIKKLTDMEVSPTYLKRLYKLMIAVYQTHARIDKQ